MSRPLGLELAGGLYQMTSRGDRREDIYDDEPDRQLWLTILAQTCECSRRFNIDSGCRFKFDLGPIAAF